LIPVDFPTGIFRWFFDFAALVPDLNLAIVGFFLVDEDEVILQAKTPE